MACTFEEDEDMFNEYEVSNGISLSQASLESAYFVKEDGDVPLSENYKVFNDPVHGHISLHPLLVKIIDTPQFQRLRSVKQLGATYFIYPGASHNRFEHCIGTSHLAGKLTRMLQKNQPNLRITDEDILCVEMAGLCHDLGHGPFSHMFETFLESVRPNSGWTHEKASCMMLDHLIQENDLWRDMQRYNIGQQDVVFVKEMIAGVEDVQVHNEWVFRGREEDKSFLYEIVSNERNKVDVDKWDYFARDCHHLGIKNSFDHNRFMHFIRVQKVNGGRLQICARDKESFNLYEMFHTRSVLHRRAYQHRVCKAIERMICDALLLAEPSIRIPGQDNKMLRLSESADDPVAYTKLNDGVFDTIQHSVDEELKPARDILTRILKRKLYRYIGGIKPIPSRISLSDIPEQIAKWDKTSQLKKEELVASKTKVNYGMKDKNPIDEFKFFSKANPRKPYHMRKADVSRMLPDVFEESELLVFCTNDSKIQLAFECFKEWFETLKIETKCGTPHTDINLTPVKNLVPSRKGHEAEKKRKLM